MQDSGDAGAKVVGEPQAAPQHFGGQAAWSLFCALVQFRLMMFILGPANYRRSVDAALGVVTGHPHWRIAQSRLLGPWLVQAMTPLFGSYLWAHVVLTVLALAIAGLLAWRIGGGRGFLTLQLGFIAVLSAPWLYAWDYLDLVAFLVFVLFVKDRRPWPWFAALYAVAIFNRDSAQFIALWLVIEGVLRRQWRPMIVGAALIPAGMALLEFLRRVLLVQEMAPKLFLDTPVNPANAVFGWQFGRNLAWAWHAIVSPDLTLPFLVPLFLAGSFAACVLLIRRGAGPLGLTFAAMTAAVPLFAILQETRAMVYLIPALVALCYAETGPPSGRSWGWLRGDDSARAPTKVPEAQGVSELAGRRWCLGRQVGLSLFCALVQFRVFMFIFGLNQYKVLVDGALGVVTGHPYWRIAQSRVLGPWMVEALAPVFGSYLGAHVALSILALTIAGVLAWRIGGWLGFLVLQFGFAALVSPPWLYAWDYLDLVAFLVFVLFVKERRSWLWFVGLYAVAIWNRDSAQFIALWLVIEGVRRRQWRPLVAGAALIPTGMMLLELLRRTLLVEEMWPKLFRVFDAPTVNTVFGFYVRQNLDWVYGALVSPDLSVPFLVPLFAAVMLGACAWLMCRGAVALGLTFAAMTAAVVMFAPIGETRAMIYLLPALVALCAVETRPLDERRSGGIVSSPSREVAIALRAETIGLEGKAGALKRLLPLLLPSLVLIVATYLVYWPALSGGFFWDDDVMLRNNPYVKSPNGLLDIWCSTRLPDFFPLTSTSFWVEWRLWGMRAAGYHLTNVLLHAASAVILWRVLRRLGVPAAWLAALVFAIHPVNVESVAWITERKNTLSMLFFLASLLLYLRFDALTQEPIPSRATHHAPRSAPSSILPLPSSLYLLSLAAFLLALLAKTSVVMMPIVLLGCAWWQRGRIERRDVLRSVPFFGLSLALGLVTMWFQSHRAIGGEVVQSASFWARLAGAGGAVWFYLGKALFPWPLSFVYPRWEINAHSLLAYLPTAALVLSAAILWRFRRSWGRAALFGLGCFVVMLLPVLGFVNIYFQRYSLVADHWQYYSIIGVIALAAGAASFLSREGFRAWPLRLGAGVAVAVMAVASWRQAGLYKSPAVLWQDTLVKNPACWMAHNNLGLFFANSPDGGQGALEQAKAHYRESLRLKPNQVEAHINLGSALMKEGRLDEAKAQFEAGAKADPANGMVYYNLGLVLEEQGKLAEAQAAYRRAFEVWPDYAEPHNNLGALLQMQGNAPAAEAEFAEAVRLQPGLARARNNLALALLARGKTAEALDQFHEVLRLEPDYPEAHNNLGKALAEQGKLAEAKAEFAEAVRLKPAYPDALFNLGNTLLMMGKPSEAITPYTAALQARPDFAEAHYQLGSLLLNLGRADEAAGHLTAALQIRPQYPEAQYQLATLLAGRKQTAEAIAHFREAVRLKPDWLEALNNLAWILATQPDQKLRNGPEAIRLAAHAVELTHTNHPGPLDTLAAAYAADGHFPEATATAQKAIDLATAAGQKPLAAEIQKRRQAYAGGQPFRE